MTNAETNPTPDHDNTLAQLADIAAYAEKLLSSVETMQNGAANAKRRHEGGLEVDLAKALEAAQKAMTQVERQVRDFPLQGSAPKVAGVSAQELIDGYWDHVAKRKETIPTGLAGLNDMLGGGLEPQRLVVLLGAPGGGKTTLANQIAVHASDAGRPVLYITSEDMPFTLLAKTLARLGKIKYTAVLKGYEDERARIDEVMREYRAGKSAERLSYLDASMGIDLDVIRDRARTHFEQFKEAGQGILVIDYLQRLARAGAGYRNGTQDLRQAVTVLTEQLRGIANELDCCVFCLASQHRQSGYGAANNALATGKESGDIEYTSDVLMAIGDDEQREPAQSWLKSKVLRIDKNRQGETGMLALDWYADRQQFTAAAQGDQVSTAASNGRKRGR